MSIAELVVRSVTGQPRVPRCNAHRGKFAYPTQQEAHAAASELWRDTGSATWPYRCPDGRHWHLTSRVTDRGQAS